MLMPLAASRSVSRAALGSKIKYTFWQTRAMAYCQQWEGPSQCRASKVLLSPWCEGTLGRKLHSVPRKNLHPQGADLGPAFQPRRKRVRGGTQGNQNEGRRRSELERNQLRMSFSGSGFSPPHPEAQTTGCSDKVCVVREGTPRVAEEGLVKRAGRNHHNQSLSHHLAYQCVHAFWMGVSQLRIHKLSFKQPQKSKAFTR
jgi:hypothetical protein